MSRLLLGATLLLAAGPFPIGRALGQPAHDDCTAATAVAALPFSDDVDTTAATVEPGDPPPSCTLGQPSTHSVWYRLESATATTAIVDLDGTDYFAILSVHDGTCGSLTETLCNSGTFDDDDPYALVPLPAGVPVYVGITDLWGSGGNLHVTITEPAAGTPVRVGPEFRVNDFDEGYQGAYLERGHGVCMAESGAFVVVWEGDTYEGSHDIFARRFDANGLPQSGDLPVSTSTAGDQALPNVACGSEGDFVVVWSGRADGGDYGIRLRRFDAAGAPAGGELQVATVDDFGPNYGRPAEVSMDAAGGFVVTWSDDGAGEHDQILAQRYDAGGSPLGTPFFVSAPQSDEQYYPDVAVAPGGDFVVVWEAGPDSDAGKRVLARRYDDAGVPLGPPFTVSSANGSLGMYTAKVDDTASGGFVVVWRDYDEGIQGRVFGATGAGAGGDFQVSDVGAGFYYEAHYNPHVTATTGGDFVVVWSKGPDDAPYIYGRRFAGTGAPVGDEFRVDQPIDYYTQIGGARMFGQGAAGATGEFVVAWASGQHEEQFGYAIRAQRFMLPTVRSCPAAPAPGCGAPTVEFKGRLGSKDKSPDKGDSFVWKWVKGQATSSAALGDPLGETGFSFCLYDGSGELIGNATVGPGGTCGTKPCWKGLGTPAGSKGYRYADRSAAADGIQKLILQAGDAGKAKVIVKGKGANLNVAAPPFLLPLTAQLHAMSGSCWTAEFRPEGVLKNQPGVFAAKASIPST